MKKEVRCSCCGEDCPPYYKSEFYDEELDEYVQTVDEDGDPEFLCCECAG